MSIEYLPFITREMLKYEPKKLFIFGDNLERHGCGGQAAQMRGEINAVGIPTKRRPTMEPDAFLYDDDLEEWFEACQPDFKRLMCHQGIIIMPTDGIGTGRAKLATKSPLIHDLLDIFIRNL